MEESDAVRGTTVQNEREQCSMMDHSAERDRAVQYGEPHCRTRERLVPNMREKFSLMYGEELEEMEMEKRVLISEYSVHTNKLFGFSERKRR